MKQLPIMPERPALFRDDDHLDVAGPGWLTQTIQGEGIFVGVPSLFVRLFGCNLSCESCDTKYTWHPGHVKNGGVPVNWRRAVQEIEKRLLGHIVITGGEPLLQAKALYRVFKYLQQQDHMIVTTVETNATIFDADFASCVQLASLSPKVSMLRRRTLECEVVDAWLRWAEDGPNVAQVKLVVESEDDAAFAALWLRARIDSRQLAPEHAIIQPEWGTSGANLKKWAPIAIEAGIRVMPQFHKVMGVP